MCQELFVALRLNHLRRIYKDVWVCKGYPIFKTRYEWTSWCRFLTPNRMTVIRLSNGGLWVHNPTELNRQVLTQIKQLGPVQHIISPSQFSQDMLPEWQKQFPEAEVRTLKNGVDEVVKDPYLNRKSFVWRILHMYRRKKREILGPYYQVDWNEYKDAEEQDYEDMKEVQGTELRLDEDKIEQISSSEMKKAEALDMKKTEDEVMRVSGALIREEKKPSDGRISVIDDSNDRMYQKKVQALRDQLEESMGPRQLNQAEGISYLASPNFGHHDYDENKLITSGAPVPEIIGDREDGLMHTQDMDEMIFDCGKYKEHVFLHRNSRSIIVTNLVESHDMDDHTMFELHCLMQIGMAAPNFQTPRNISTCFSDLQKARESCIRLLMWDWDNVFMAHGVHRLSNGKAHMRQAMYWLLNPVQIEALKYKVFPEAFLDSRAGEENYPKAKRKRSEQVPVSEYGV